MKEKEVKYEIKKHIAVLSKNETSDWQKEVNLVSWNDKPEKFDVRDWNQDHSKMGKGVTLTTEEAKVLAKAITKELK